VSIVRNDPGPGGHWPSEADELLDSLSIQGRGAVASAVGTVQSVVIVVVWFVIAAVVAGAMAFASLSLPLDQTGQWIAGIATLVSFLAILVVGSLLTLRWLYRRGLGM
jgi:hypothetical protein